MAISGRTVVLHFGTLGQPSIVHVDERCQYRMSSANRIVLMLPSSHYQTGVGRFEYFWTGAGIKVADPETGRVMFFSPQK